MFTATMNTTNGFSRYEACYITGLDYNRLIYLERLNLVEPKKMGGFKRTFALYSLKDLICVMIADKYKNRFSNEAIKTIVEFVYDYKDIIQSYDKRLIHIRMSSNNKGYDCVGFIDKDANSFEAFEDIKKRCQDLEIPLPLIDDWDDLEVKVKRLEPIQDFIRQLLDNVKRCPEMDYKDFIQRANLEAA